MRKTVGLSHKEESPLKSDKLEFITQQQAFFRGLIPPTALLLVVGSPVQLTDRGDIAQALGFFCRDPDLTTFTVR